MRQRLASLKSQIVAWLSYLSDLKVLIPAATLLMIFAAILAIGARELLSRLSLSLFELLVIAFVLLLGIWALRERRITYIQPFQNLTGDDSNKAKYDALASGFAELMALDFQRVNRLRNIGDWPEPKVPQEPPTRRGEKTDVRGQTTKPFARIGVTTGVQLGETLSNVGTLSMGGVNVPLGPLLNFALQIFQYGISGSLQKHGSALVVVANFSGPRAHRWMVRSDKLAAKFKSEEEMIAELARQMVYEMIFTFGDTTASCWQSYYELLEGLEHYNAYLISARSSTQDLIQAKEHFQQAIAIDPQFADAYYNLGLIYDEETVTYHDVKAEGEETAVSDEAKVEDGETTIYHNVKKKDIWAIVKPAIEMYRTTIQLEPRHYEAHLRLAQSYYHEGNLEDAILECNQAVQQGMLSDPLYPEARRWLGFLWGEKALEARDAEERRRLFQKGVAEYKRAIRELDAVAQKGSVQSAPATSSQYRDQRSQLWLELGWAYENLGNSIIDEGRDEAQRIRLAKEKKATLQSAEKALIAGLRRRDNGAEAYLLVGQFYAHQKKFQAAYKYLQRALEIDPNNVELQITITKMLYDKARRELDVLSPTPDGTIDLPHGHTLENQLRDLGERLDIATNVFEKALSVSPWEKQVWSNLAYVHYMKGDILARVPTAFSGREEAIVEFNRAIALYGKLLALDPDDATLSDLSAVYARRDPLCANRDASISHADKSDLAHDLAETYASLRKILKESAIDQAVKEIRLLCTGLDKCPAKRALLWTQGWLLAKVGQKDQAAATLKQARAIAPKVPFYEAKLTQHNLAFLYSELRKWDDVIDEIQAGRAFEPLARQVGNYAQSLMDLASMLSIGERYEDVVKVCDEVLETAGEDIYLRSRALAERAHVFNRLNKFVAAIQDCHVAIRLAPFYAYPRYVLADVYANLRDYDQAIESWRRYAEKASSQSMAIVHQNIGKLVINKARSLDNKPDRSTLLNQAIDEYRQAIAAFGPDNPEERIYRAPIYGALGSILAVQGRNKEASQAYEQAIALQEDTTNLDWHIQLAKLYTKQENFLEAESNYRKVTDLCKQGLKKAAREGNKDLFAHYKRKLAAAYNGSARYLHAEQGVNLNEGLRLANRALTLVKDDPNGGDRSEYLDTRGWIHYKMGNLDGAIADIESALDLTFGTVYMRYHLAAAYAQKASTATSPTERDKWMTQALVQREYVLELDAEGILRPSEIEQLKRIVTEKKGVPTDEKPKDSRPL